MSDAIVELEEALHLSPGNVQARRLLSRAYQRNGNKERARQYAESACARGAGAGRRPVRRLLLTQMEDTLEMNHQYLQLPCGLQPMLSFWKGPVV